METEEYLNQLTKTSSPYENYEHSVRAEEPKTPVSKPSIKYHCYTSQTDVYSKLIGVRLPYGSAANVTLQPDGSVTFTNSSVGYQSRVTVFADSRVIQETLCSSTSASCTSRVTQSSTSLESAAILISTLNPSASLPFDAQSATYQTFVTDLAAAKRTDKQDCQMYSSGCP